MADIKVTVVLTLKDEDVIDVYKGAFDDEKGGKSPQDALDAIIETALFDADNSDVALKGEFEIVSVETIEESDESDEADDESDGDESDEGSDDEDDTSSDESVPA